MDEKKFHDLLIRSQIGDAQAYQCLLELSYTYLNNRLKKWLSRAELREEVTQEILLGLHHSLKTFTPGHNSLAWIHAITRYKVIDYLRKNPHQFQEFIDNVTNEEDSTNELIEAVYMALDKLSPEVKAAITLTKLEGYSTQEVAKKLGMKENALRTKLSRAFAKIREELIK
nr:RNA polymerase sigma factor [Bacteriovorax sp. HI3]